MQNKLIETRRLAEAVERLGAEYNLPIKVVFRVTLALGEVVANVINHGYDDGDDQEIIVNLDVIDQELICKVEDAGIPFNPLEAPLPDIAEHARQRKSGGLGILFMRTFMDHLAYERTDDRNILTLRKSLQQ